MITNFLNPEGHQNPISGSKFTAILLKGWILPFGGASSGRVCACSLRSRLDFYLMDNGVCRTALAKTGLLKIPHTGDTDSLSVCGD